MNKQKQLVIVVYGAARMAYLQNLPVVPPVVRPSVKADNNTRSKDITHKYINILKVNRALRQKLESKGTPQNIIDAWVSSLQYNVATLVDNKIPKIPLSNSVLDALLKH